MYLAAQRDGLDYHITYIPDDFDQVPTEAFDTSYMKALFQVGHKLATEGRPWMDEPPCYSGCKDFNYIKNIK
jgi:hypothetical protein